MRKTQNSEGSIVVVVLILVLIASAMVASYLSLCSNDARLTRISLDEQKAVMAAEAGLDYGIVKLKDVILYYQLSPLITGVALQGMLDAIPPPPGIGDYAYQTPSGASAFRIQIESPIVEGIITNGTACRGSYGNVQLFTVTCGAINTKSGAGAVLKQTVQAVGLCLIRFGVFYQPDLEILPGASMTFAGPVHANGNLYLGGPLQFHDRLTTHGNIYHRRKDDPAQRPGETWIKDAEGDLKSMKVGAQWLDSDYPEWMSDALTRWKGTVLSAAHGVAELSPPISPTDEAHDIIERSLPTNHPSYGPLTEKEKFANKAALRIHVDSNGVFTATDYFTNDVTAVFAEAVLQTNGSSFAKDTHGAYQFLSNGTYTTGASFVDRREGCAMAPVDIYLDQLLATYTNLHTDYTSDEGRGIVYVTRDDPDGSGGVMPCVRLRNGREISAVSGLSIVSDLPVYIEGDYNSVTTKPSLVAGDAVTLLSKAWQDSKSGGGEGDRTAVDTEYRTVIMTGNEETAAGDYNGGLENVLRFLEHWSGKTTTFRGSIVNLWTAETAVGDWYYGSYDGTFRYTAPNRDWGYDEIYRFLSPPGMTYVFGMEEIYWGRTTWAAEGW